MMDDNSFMGNNINIQQMYDAGVAEQLANKSHNRGLLSKEFYQLEQAELDRKRKEMKRVLDQQVEERRKKKEMQRLQAQYRLKREQEEIKRYYAGLQQRQPTLQANQTQANQTQANQTNSNYNNSNYNNPPPPPSNPNKGQSQYSSAKLPYQTFPIQSNPSNPMDSRFRNKNTNQQQQQQYQSKPRSNSKASIVEGGDLLVMPLSDNTYTYKKNGSNYQQYEAEKKERDHTGGNNNGYNNGNNAHYEAIPLLDLSAEPTNIKAKKSKPKNSTKRQKESNIKQSNVVPSLPNHAVISPSQERKSTVQNQDDRLSVSPSFHGNQHAYTYVVGNNSGGNINQNQSQNQNQSHKNQHQYHNQTEIAQQIFVVEEQNKTLKQQLKKSQEAISLLIGAVRSSSKLDKFRVQAERILYNGIQHKKEDTQNTQGHGHVHQNTHHPQQNTSNTENQQSPSGFLPKLSLKHQSIMHDYILNAAKRNHKHKY